MVQQSNSKKERDNGGIGNKATEREELRRTVLLIGKRMQHKHKTDSSVSNKAVRICVNGHCGSVTTYTPLVSVINSDDSKYRHCPFQPNTFSGEGSI